MVRSKTKPDVLKQTLTDQVGAAKADQVIKALNTVAEQTIDNPQNFLPAVRKQLPILLDVYSSCSAYQENAGHRFGEDLSDQDKNALTAFLATL